MLVGLKVVSAIAYNPTVEIRFSRHAKNKLRLYKLAPDDVTQAINLGERLDQGDKWESRYGKLRAVWVLVGSYALVVTVIRTR